MSIALPGGAVVTIDPVEADEIARGLQLLADERRRDGFAWRGISELREQFTALARGRLSELVPEEQPVSVRQSDYGSRDDLEDGDGVTTREAASLLGLTQRRVRQLCEDGELVAERVDGRWRVDREALEVTIEDRGGAA